VDDAKEEWLACSLSFVYFVDRYVKIYDATSGGWIPFELWPEQVRVAEELVNNRLVAILKARQLGLTWLVLAYILWMMVFHPAGTMLLFSRREVEAIYMLDKRLKGMYNRLPEWMGVRSIISDSAHIWELSNGSVAYAFPTTAGDSYTATLAFVDEADLLPDLDDLMLAVKPTIDGGGKMILLSRSDKAAPNSPFKKIFIEAWAGRSAWKGIFLPWFARPSRTAKWYKDQEDDFMSRTGTSDGLHEQYPATPEEALAPRSLNKRIPFAWLQRCYVPMKGTRHASINGLTVYREPQLAHSYIISGDPAEGNPTSDDSSAHVLDGLTLEECAMLVGKFEPLMFAEQLLEISEYYRDADIMVERNNHGHAVIATIRTKEDKAHLLMRGQDGRYGWPQTGKSKAHLYSEGAKLLKDGAPTIHSSATFLQLADIEGSTLKAPEGSFDDQAVSYMLGVLAASAPPVQNFGFQYASSHRHNSKLNARRRRHSIGSIS